MGGLLTPFGTQVLAGNDRAAGSQCAEQRNDKLVDHIDKRNAGDGGLPHRGHHDSICHTYEDFQCLLYDERPQQRKQLPIGK